MGYLFTLSSVQLEEPETKNTMHTERGVVPRNMLDQTWT